MEAVAVGAILFAVLLVIGAALVWQEARSGREPEPATYLVDDAIAFVHDGLPPELAERVSRDDVRSLLEWSRYHSQVVVARSGAEIPVLGGPEAVSFVNAQAALRGLDHTVGEITTVLDLEAAYLLSIGAIGDPVEEESA
jgi:hypothetical protein